MKKIETLCGYDIYELSREECNRRHISHFTGYPVFALFVKGENFETVGWPEALFQSLINARTYCERYPVQ